MFIVRPKIPPLQKFPEVLMLWRTVSETVHVISLVNRMNVTHCFPPLPTRVPLWFRNLRSPPPSNDKLRGSRLFSLRWSISPKPAEKSFSAGAVYGAVWGGDWRHGHAASSLTCADTTGHRGQTQRSLPLQPLRLGDSNLKGPVWAYFLSF